MPTQDEIQKILDLGHKYELIAANTFSRAQKQCKHGSPKFNQAYHDYVSTMHNVQDMYYKMAHDLTQSVVSGEDLNKIVGATQDLQDKLDQLQGIESGIAISLDILSVAVTVTAAVVDPTHLSAGAAVVAVINLGKAISAAVKSKARPG